MIFINKIIHGIYNMLFDDTPLICAARKNHIKIVDLLLSQNNIDINCADIRI